MQKSIRIFETKYVRISQTSVRKKYSLIVPDSYNFIRQACFEIETILPYLVLIHSNTISLKNWPQTVFYDIISFNFSSINSSLLKHKMNVGSLNTQVWSHVTGSVSQSLLPGPACDPHTCPVSHVTHC